MSGSRKIRVLHVLGSMNIGGVETWLMHILRHIDHDHYQLDIMVHLAQEGTFEAEARHLGARIIRCLHPHHPLQYARNFLQILHENGPYDVVHSHVHHFSGLIVWLASLAHVPMRIAHSHSDTSLIQAHSPRHRQLYFAVTRTMINQVATHWLAPTYGAAIALFGPKPHQDARLKIFHHAIDLAPFHRVMQTSAKRGEIGLPPNALVIGHVGSFSPPKNHDFVLNIFAEVVKKQPNAHLLLVGDGSRRAAIEDKIRGLALESRVTLLGLRDDVPDILLNCIDLFLFPSLYEGMSLALLEAQAAGIPCVCSDTVAEETDVVPSLIHRLSLQQPAEQWAEVTVTTLHTPPPLSKERALQLVEASPANIHRVVEALEGLYSVSSR